MKQLNIGFLGAKHTHYIDFGRYAQQSPYCRVAGVWDDDPEKTARFAAALKAPVYESYQAMLADPAVDGVVITSTPYMHEEHIIAAAKAGKAVFVEQPLAVTNEAAERIRDAVKESGIPFVLSNPVKRSGYLFAKQLLDSGLMGEPLNMRVRTLHDNTVLLEQGKFPDFEYIYDHAQSGGGAMNNMGCHGVKLLLWFFGMPETAAGIFTSLTERGKANNIEENAVTVFKFPNGAIGTIETGWVHPRYQGNWELNCTHGSVIQTPDGLYYRLDCRGDGWVKAMDKLLPAPMDHPFTYWVEHLYNGTPMDEFGVDEAVAFTRMIVAAYNSQGREVPV